MSRDEDIGGFGTRAHRIEPRSSAKLPPPHQLSRGPRARLFYVTRCPGLQPGASPARQTTSVPAFHLPSFVDVSLSIRLPWLQINCTLVLGRGPAEHQRLCLLATAITSPRVLERVAQVEGGRRTANPISGSHRGQLDPGVLQAGC